jgi:hypothetical protein
MPTPLLTLAAASTLYIADLPPPVATYARKFESSCRAEGLGPAIANEMFVEKLFDVEDANLDGTPDYFVYECMFGCERNRFAFASGSPPCPSGVLLLSANGTHQLIHLPGTIKTIIPGERPAVALTRRRNLGDGCTVAFGCQYVYEVRDGRFQLIGECAPEGCDALLKQE